VADSETGGYGASALGPRDPWSYSSQDGFLIQDGRIRVFGFSVAPEEPLVNPRIARRTPVTLTLAPGRYSWCTCGYSRNQPFCDDSHQKLKGTPQWKSYKFQVLEECEVTLCRCKRTKSPPFCDCRHDSLP